MWRLRNVGEAGLSVIVDAPRSHGVGRACREIVLQLLLIVATLATLELLLRAADLRELRDGYGQGYAVVHRYDPELGWLPVPNSARTFGGSRPISIQHNSLGLQFGDPKLEAFLHAQAIRYTSFDGADSYTVQGNHWTPKGHALVADRLKALLSEAGVVK
jgi:hypothetical protein